MSLTDQITLGFQRVAAELKKPKPSVRVAPPGWLQPPAGCVGTAAVAFTSASRGKLFLTPFDTGPVTARYTAQAVGVGTQQVAGTGSLVRTGVYGAQPNGYPDLTNLILSTSGSMNMLATGWRFAAIDWTPPPNAQFWSAFLWTSTADPTQFPTVFGVNPAPMLPHVSTLAPGTAVRGYSATGLSALPTTQIALGTSGGSDSVAVFYQTAA